MDQTFWQRIEFGKRRARESVQRESDLSWPAEILCQSININPSDKPETNQAKTSIADGIGIGIGTRIGIQIALATQFQSLQRLGIGSVVKCQPEGKDCRGTSALR